MPWADEVKAILECFYGGQGIGRAIVKVISGEVNPSGHMPVSVPAFREQIISDENFAEQTEQVTYREGMFMGYRGYETKKIPVQFPFGFGLSYTTFEITECSVEQEKITDCEKTVLRGKIKNTGNRKGAQVVQLYVKNPRAWKARPARELRDFRKSYWRREKKKSLYFPFHVNCLNSTMNASMSGRYRRECMDLSLDFQYRISVQHRRSK